jgi:osmotically-inducible protein OsmY
MSTAEVQQQIQQHLDSEPLLRSADIRARAQEDSVALTGTVDNESQHELALRITQSYAGERKIIDKIKVRG